jgi:hypothetical protein
MITSALAKSLRLGMGWLLGCSLLAPAAQAMAFYSTADTNYNTTAPTGSIAYTAWQWVGFWGSFQATPIDAHHFIAANHVGGAVGDTFVFQGANYTTVQTYGEASSDLRIWEVREAFPVWAPLYRNSDENGKNLVVFGRGVTRGAEVRTTVAVSGVPANSLAGWQYGPSDGKLRWGQNTVAGFYTDPSFGPQLVATFDKNAGINECHLGSGDSSGPVFIQDVNDGNKWKLAGVAGLVESGFSTTASGSTYAAFIFDKRGLYVSGNGPQTGISPLPSAFLATRISTQTAWIDGILATPLTATVTLGNLSQTYDGTALQVAATTNPAGLAVTVTYSGSTTAPVNAGNYAVLATVTSSGYSGSASGTLTIAKANQTTTFGALSPVSAGDPAFALGATASSGLAVTYTSSNATAATVSGSIVTIVGVGSSTITADQAGNTNYYGAPTVSQILTVNPAVQGTPAVSSDAPISSPLMLALLALLLLVTGSSHLRKSTRPAS